MRIVSKFKALLLFPFSKSKPSPLLRTADVLLLQDHGEDRLLRTDGCRGSSNCSRPCRIPARFFFCFNRGKLTNKVHDDRKKEDHDVAPPDLSPGELQKITESRIQMEGVLQTVKVGLQNKDLLVSKNLESNEGDGIEESLCFNNNRISSKVLFDQKCDGAPKEEDCIEGMDRLKAELDVELERLQLVLDSGKFPTNPLDKTIEMQRKKMENPEQQITELEAALGSSKKELREKEREISQWKDSAHLMLEHVKKTFITQFPARSTCSTPEMRRKEKRTLEIIMLPHRE
ncbi:hypothetical protein F3Y22_tig00111238pilonHSYRG00190 [Hibiscus syriacus]|uniref:Uncharacterized protein n=1 Tax=Hibiscus syriacus TaxID=106335 RepID=A0A6A2YT87_HIBSY|nr:hypothetical protein F3Y22_tig00111238pilonHSYRG00190 [Hibiscus syriacus]